MKETIPGSSEASKNGKGRHNIKEGLSEKTAASEKEE